MAAAKAYVVLARNHSSSSSKMHEVRRGGDGVLYCTCKGWAFNKQSPKVCRHTEDYVAENPGTAYNITEVSGYQRRKMVVAEQAQAKLRKAYPKAIGVPDVTAVSAGPDWRSMLLAERDKAKSRGIETPSASLMAYAMDLDLD